MHCCVLSGRLGENVVHLDGAQCTGGRSRPARCTPRRAEGSARRFMGSGGAGWEALSSQPTHVLHSQGMLFADTAYTLTLATLNTVCVEGEYKAL